MSWPQSSGLGGCAAREFDLKYGKAGDISLPIRLSAACSRCTQWALCGGMFAPPCGTFSAALFWTEPLRSLVHPWCRPGFNERRRLKASGGNQALRGCIEIIRELDKHGRPWILENPVGSLMWQVPFFKSGVGSKGISIVADHSRFGKPSKKRTRFTSNNIEESKLRVWPKALVTTNITLCPKGGGPDPQSNKDRPRPFLSYTVPTPS